MPVIILCGLPCSGKTRRAQELKDFFLDNSHKEVSVISDQDFGIDKNDVYSDSRKEKDLRGNLKAALQRTTQKDVIVILDSPNYIKGFRYELYCSIKSAQTPFCVIQCCTSHELATQRNADRQDGEKYKQDVLDGLVMRFESPDSRNRWDSPLFLAHPDEPLPLTEIADAIFGRKAPPRNKSTQSQPLSATNFLHELDRITQATISVIMDSQKMCAPGDKITIPGATVKVEYTRTLTLAELQRLRRQFITFTKAHPMDDMEKLANIFINFINTGIK